MSDDYKRVHDNRKSKEEIITKKGILTEIIDKKIKEEALKQKLETKGNGKYIAEGMIARLFDYYIIPPELIEDIPSRLSFTEAGYKENANSLLMIMCLTNKIPEKIIKTIEIKKLSIEIPPVEEILYNVGAKDAKEGYIVEKDIIANNEYYKTGYNEHKKKR